jgi:hypothetical protein
LGQRIEGIDEKTALGQVADPGFKKQPFVLIAYFGKARTPPGRSFIIVHLFPFETPALSRVSGKAENFGANYTSFARFTKYNFSLLFIETESTTIRRLSLF